VSAIHLFRGLPLVLVPIGFHCNILLGVLLSYFLEGYYLQLVSFSFLRYDVHVASLQKSVHIPGSKSHYHICVLIA